MESTAAKVCKNSAMIIFILGFFGALVVGDSIGADGLFRFVFTFGLLLGDFLFCLLLYAVGEIIGKLTEISNYFRTFYYMAFVKPCEPENPTYADGWNCKKCGKRNHKNSVACSGCGELK